MKQQRIRLIYHRLIRYRRQILTDRLAQPWPLHSLRWQAGSHSEMTIQIAAKTIAVKTIAAKTRVEKTRAADYSWLSRSPLSPAITAKPSVRISDETYS